MHRQLIIKSFEQAQKDIGSEVPARQSEHLSKIVKRHSNQPFGARRLGDFYKWSKANSPRNIELKQFVVKSLCAYLGYEDFKAFHEEFPAVPIPPPTIGQKIEIVFRQNRITIITALLVILGFSTYNYITRERWMVWEQDHYTEVPFNAEKLANGELKLFKKERIDHFKQVDPDCNYPFFKEDSSENLWYGKNKDGELEYFTDLGLHPGTGRTLKKITPYMIQKYICPSF